MSRRGLRGFLGLLHLTLLSVRILGMTGHQSPLSQHQISQIKESEQRRRILGEASVEGFVVRLKNPPAAVAPSVPWILTGQH